MSEIDLKTHDGKAEFAVMVNAVVPRERYYIRDKMLSIESSCADISKRIDDEREEVGQAITKLIVQVESLRELVESRYEKTTELSE